jgi:hypothetical protein
MAEYKKPTKSDISRGAYTPIVNTSQKRPKAGGKKHPNLFKAPKSK